MDRTSRQLMSLFALGAVLTLGACGDPSAEARKEPLLPAETFNWGPQPLAFQPPPADWERHRHNEGGLLGVWFTHRNSVGERIYISEYTKVGRRAANEGRLVPYTIDQVVAETRFSTEFWPVPADSFEVAEMLPDSLAGVPAYRLDFSLNMPGKFLVGREYYFVQNNHLFEAAYLGLPENLPLFERVVDTITLLPLVEP